MLNKVINICLNIILGTFLLLVIVLGLAFTFIEGRFVFSFEWLIYPDVFNAFIRYFLRLVLSISLIGYGVMEYINIFKKSIAKAHICFGMNIGYCVLGILLFVFASNYVDIVGLILPFILLIIKALLTFVTRHYTNA